MINDAVSARERGGWDVFLYVESIENAITAR